MSSNIIEFLNPDGLNKSPAYSQVSVVSGRVKTIYIGGQNAIDKGGDLVGAEDFGAQTKKILENIKIILESQGASFSNIVKMNIFMKEGCNPHEGFMVFQSFMSDSISPPPITSLFVSGFANPDCLLEIDAVAVVDDSATR